MKERYETPTVVEVALYTEQRILDVSLKVLMATTPLDSSDPMNMTEGDGWDTWD